MGLFKRIKDKNLDIDSHDIDSIPEDTNSNAFIFSFSVKISVMLFSLCFVTRLTQNYTFISALGESLLLGISTFLIFFGSTHFGKFTFSKIKKKSNKKIMSYILIIIIILMLLTPFILVYVFGFK